jgi:site-specific DNA-methyltransferase (adenine-specific)
MINLFCDSFDNIGKSIDDNSVDLIVTDPPYGVDFKNSKFFNDSKDHILENIDDWMKEMYRMLKDTSHIYIFVPTLEIDLWVNSFKKYFTFKNIIATQVYVNNRYNVDNFGWDLQLIIYGSKGKAKRFNAVNWIPASDSWVNDKRNTDPKPFTYKYPSFISNKIIRSNYKNNNKRKRLHPNEKNDELIANFIQMSTNPNDLVLDPFCGAGSTVLACLKTNRNCIGIDKNQEFIDISKKRIEDYESTSSL